MPVSIGPRIQVDGEAEYRQQISNIIEQGKTLDAEMRALTATFSDNATAEEKAAATTDLLNRQLDNARERTNLVREMTQKSAEATGENSRETLKWRQALANAAEQEAKLERAAEDNTKALDKQGEAAQENQKKMTGLGDTLDSVAGKLGIHLPESAKGALNGMEGLSVGTVTAMSAAAGGVAVLMKAVSELHQMTLEAAEWADGLLTRSAQTGIDAETLQGLDYASNFLDFEGIDQSLVKLTASMDKAREGAEAQSAAFDVLGVSVLNTDGTLRSNWETFLAVIDSLGEIENATERDTVANDLFGKSYSELKPLIDAGTDALQEYMDTAKKNGIVLTESQIKILGEVDDAHKELQATIDATKNKLAVDFAPASKQAMETFARAVKLGGDTLEETGIVRNTASLIENIFGIVDAGLDMIDALPKWLNPIESVSNTMKGLAVVAATVADSMSLVASLMTLDFHGAATALGWNLQKGEMSHLQQLKYSDPKYVHYNAAGDENWRGGLTWVGEAGPELVALPRGSRIYNNQESQQMTAAGTDTSRMEALLERNVQLLEAISGEFSGLRVRRRMA